MHGVGERPARQRSTDAGRATWDPRHPIPRGARRGARPQRARHVRRNRGPASSWSPGAWRSTAPTGIGVAPTADTVLSCTDTWTGGGGTSDWNGAGNWNAGVPQGSGVDGVPHPQQDATVVVQNATFSIGELTVAKGSSLTVGGDAGGTGQAGASLSVSSGLDNGGTLTAGPTGTGHGPGHRHRHRHRRGRRHGHTHPRRADHEHRGPSSVSGTVTIGVASPSSLTNAGTVGVAPGGLIDLEKSSTLTNASERADRLRDRRAADIPVGLRQDHERHAVARRQRRTGVRERVHPLTGCRVRRGGRLVQRDVRHRSQRCDGRLLHPGCPSASSAARQAWGHGRRHHERRPRHRCSGRTCRFTATVTSDAGSDPTGSVSFSAGGVLLGSAPAVTAVRGDDRHLRHGEPPGGIGTRRPATYPR